MLSWIDRMAATYCLSAFFFLLSGVFLYLAAIGWFRKLLAAGLYASTDYTDFGLTAGTTYYYKVQASDGLRTSIKSDPVWGTTLVPPSKPTGLSASEGTSECYVSLSGIRFLAPIVTISMYPPAGTACSIDPPANPLSALKKQARQIKRGPALMPARYPSRSLYRTAFFTSSRIFSSPAGVRFASAKAVGQRSPSSSFAPSLKPKVA